MASRNGCELLKRSKSTLIFLTSVSLRATSWVTARYLVSQDAQAAQVVPQVERLGAQSFRLMGVLYFKSATAHPGLQVIMIKKELGRGVSPYSAKMKSTVKTKEDGLLVVGMPKMGQLSRMVGTSAPPKPVYLIPPFASDESVASKLAASHGKKQTGAKRTADKIDHLLAAKAPKPKTGPPNGVVALDKSNLLESVGYHTAAGRSDGRMKTNQDAFIVHSAVRGDPNRALLGVFDGHGLQGHKVSNYLVNNLLEVLQLPPVDAPTSELSKAFTDACHNLHNMLRRCVYIDSKLSGSTGVMVLVEPNRIICSNVGDSRAVLFHQSGNGLAHLPLSIDQKPSDPQEKARILSHGGKVHPTRSRLP